MATPHGLKVLFVAGFGPIVENAAPSKASYADALALPLLSSPDEPDYLHTEKVNRVRHFALWPLASAARSCFGADVWPAEMPKPTAWIEFDVEDVRPGERRVAARRLPAARRFAHRALGTNGHPVPQPGGAAGRPDVYPVDALMDPVSGYWCGTSDCHCRAQGIQRGTAAAGRGCGRREHPGRSILFGHINQNFRWSDRSLCCSAG